VAKSNRRKRQDRVKATAKRAEQTRRHARAEREQQLAERYRRLLDPLTSPADVAGILAAELPDSLVAGAMMQIRLSFGVPGEEIAQTARLMLAAATGPPQIGTLAVAAWAAHATGDEDAERGYASELLSRADAVDDPELRLEVIRAAWVRGHPGEACELIEPHLRERPDDELAAGIYAEALAAAYTEADPGEPERAALARYGDRSGSEALRAAIDAFLNCTEWGTTVRKWTDAERSRLAAENWQAAERDQFDALAVEVAITYPVADVSGSPAADGADGGDDPVNTPLRAFAVDPAMAGELVARASEWDRHVRFGIWQVEEPQTAPGVWCTELVSGLRRYAQFPAAALDGAAPWSVWLGALVPADGIWRSTGNGVWLSPVEGDAVAEYAEQAVWHVLEELSGVPRDRLPGPGEIRFGQAEPYCVRWETGVEPEPEFGENFSPVLARLTTMLASRVWWKRSAPVMLTNTDGEPMVLIDATVTVSGDVTGRLSARSDFAEEEGGQDGQLVWWGDQITDPSSEPIVMHVHQDGSAHLLDPAEDPERLVLGRLTPDGDRVRVQVNSHRRLTRLLQILADIGAEPEVAGQTQSEPSLDYAWGPVPDSESPAREWEKAWLEQSVVVLDFRSPRHSAASAAEGSTAEALRLEGLLRQLEYQAGLAAARGARPIDTGWLRTELGLTTPLSERLAAAAAGLDGLRRRGIG
jgi:hypothetical protein